MKVLKYKMCTRVNRGTEEEPKWEENLSSVVMGWNEVNEETAKKEAYNGEYTIEDEQQTSEEQITELKAQLSATDYKIIKCSEYQLAGLDMPYDIAELHAQRQAIRDQINQLEQE